jgi:hypothetical protein
LPAKPGPTRLERAEERFLKAQAIYVAMLEKRIAKAKVDCALAKAQMERTRLLRELAKAEAGQAVLLQELAQAEAAQAPEDEAKP